MLLDFVKFTFALFMQNPRPHRFSHSIHLHFGSGIISDMYHTLYRGFKTSFFNTLLESVVTGALGIFCTC